MVAKSFQIPVKMDSKGRISIPAWVRRNIGVDENTAITISFNWQQSLVTIEFDTKKAVVKGL